MRLQGVIGGLEFQAFRHPVCQSEGYGLIYRIEAAIVLEQFAFRLVIQSKVRARRIVCETQLRQANNTDVV
jgi:hypothetical protein